MDQKRPDYLLQQTDNGLFLVSFPYIPPRSPLLFVFFFNFERRYGDAKYAVKKKAVSRHRGGEGRGAIVFAALDFFVLLFSRTGKLADNTKQEQRIKKALFRKVSGRERAFREYDV